ncbi:MAG: methyl-accepting chemotaxis protein [Candidatus Riflebacteria bacterium]|nr:methyl-accepting chemotaxis protein [Candidatus Riflebacteria bacterium]
MIGLRTSLQPLFICLGLGVFLVLVEMTRMDSSISEWKGRTTALLTEALRGVAMSGLTQTYETLNQRISHMEGWASLHFFPEQIRVDDVDRVISKALVDLKKQMGLLEAVCLGPKGALIASADPSPTTSSLVRFPPGTDLPAGVVFPSQTTILIGPKQLEGRRVLIVECPIADRKAAGEIVGVLRGVIDLDELSTDVFSSLKEQDLPRAGRQEHLLQFAVFDSSGSVLASTLEKTPQTLAAAGLEFVLKGDVDPNDAGAVRVGGVEYMSAVAKSWIFRTKLAAGRHPVSRHAATSRTAWGFLVLQPFQSTIGVIVAQARSDQVSSLAITVVSVVFFFVILIIRFVSPTMRFAAFAKNVSLGHTGERLDYRSQNEFGVLAGALNQMLDTIQAKTNQLQEMATQEVRLEEATRRESEQVVLQRAIESHLESIGRVAEGDLGVRFQEDGPREMSILGRHLNNMVQQMARMIGEMRSAVVRLGTVTSEILATIAQQVENFQVEGTVLRRTGSSVEGLHDTASQSIAQAEKVVEKASDSARVFREEEVALEKVVQSIDGITRKSEISGDSMTRLATELDKVDDILGSVNDIAEQSKLLSLNAAIEAARAKEYGKGFAVVAMEVRNLAAQSREATAQVKIILRGIREAAEQVAVALKAGSDEAQRGLELMHRVRAFQDQLKSALDQSTELARRVLQSSTIQYRSLEEMNQAMKENIQRMEQNVESARSIQDSMQELGTLAHSLQQTAQVFKAMESKNPLR